MKASRNFLLAFIAAAFLCGNHTQAQQWPQNNIKLVVSAAAGGPIDVFARVSVAAPSLICSSELLREDALKRVKAAAADIAKVMQISGTSRFG